MWLQVPRGLQHSSILKRIDAVNYNGALRRTGLHTTMHNSLTHTLLSHGSHFCLPTISWGSQQTICLGLAICYNPTSSLWEPGARSQARQLACLTFTHLLPVIHYIWGSRSSSLCAPSIPRDAAIKQSSIDFNMTHRLINHNAFYDDVMSL